MLDGTSRTRSGSCSGTRRCSATAAERVAVGRPRAAARGDAARRPVLPDPGQYGSDWRADVGRAGGGTLLEHSIHDVDVLRWVLGEPDAGERRVASRFGHAGIDDVADATLTFADGTDGDLVSVWHQILRRPSTRRLEVFCEDALLWADDDHLGPLHIETADAVTEVVSRARHRGATRSISNPRSSKPLLQYAEPAKAFLDARRHRSTARSPTRRPRSPRTGWSTARTARRASGEPRSGSWTRRDRALRGPRRLARQ